MVIKSSLLRLNNPAILKKAQLGKAKPTQQPALDKLAPKRQNAVYKLTAPVLKEDANAIADRLKSIIDKLKTGKTLSPNELNYLAEHSPVYHQKALFVKQERERYRQELKACRSKEEVRRKREMKLSQFATELSAIDKTGLSNEHKEVAREFVAMRREGCEREYEEFKASEHYKQLPERRKRRTAVSYEA